MQKQTPAQPEKEKPGLHRPSVSLGSARPNDKSILSLASPQVIHGLCSAMTSA